MKVTGGESEAFVEDLGAMLDEFKVPGPSRKSCSIKQAVSVAGTSGDRHQRRH
jgi:hypothetical protein